LNLLPILWKDAQDGHRATLMTCKPFDQLLDGVGYADCIVYDGQPGDVAGATAAAKKLSDDVRVAHLPFTPEEQKAGVFKEIKTESWAKEAWRLTGRLDLWRDNLPLIFDKRDTAREAALIPDYMAINQPTIVLATGGVSSPFPFQNLLKTLLELRFRRPWKILDVSTIKAHRLYDIIGILEKAKVLVAADSAMLHLARAVPRLPVVALQQDRPAFWNGSPWRPEWIWSCRYHDFPRRGPSMLQAINDLYHGGLPYNPTIKREGGALAHVFSAYEGIAGEARENWTKAYEEACWIHTPVYYGVFGRDSRSVGDRLRFPFVKDVIRTAMARTVKPTDKIILTRSDTCFTNSSNLEWIENIDTPIYCHRAIRNDKGDLTHHPAIDLFTFTRQWWEDHRAEYPDMLLGRDFLWQQALRELMVKHGGKELPWLTYQAKA
jgi:hypothetical protein